MAHRNKKKKKKIKKTEKKAEKSKDVRFLLILNFKSFATEETIA